MYIYICVCVYIYIYVCIYILFLTETVTCLLGISTYIINNSKNVFHIYFLGLKIEIYVCVCTCVCVCATIFTFLLVPAAEGKIQILCIFLYFKCPINNEKQAAHYFQLNCSHNKPNFKNVWLIVRI